MPITIERDFLYAVEHDKDRNYSVVKDWIGESIGGHMGYSPQTLFPISWPHRKIRLGRADDRQLFWRKIREEPVEIPKQLPDPDKRKQAQALTTAGSPP